MRSQLLPRSRSVVPAFASSTGTHLVVSIGSVGRSVFNRIMQKQTATEVAAA